MTPTRLLARSLAYHWRANLALLLGVAVGTAVLTGALLVGDSQRDSLKQLALRRLGWVDQALAAPRFFGEDLAGKLSADADHVCPALLLSGSISTEAGGSVRSARKVTILGVDDRFLPGVREPWLGKPGTDASMVFLNAALARALDVQDGDRVKLHLQKQRDGIPRETLLGRKGSTDVEQKFTLEVRILPDGAPGADFSLAPGPQLPRNAFVPLAVLQKQLDLDRQVNAILAGGVKGNLDEALARRLTLADWGLSLQPSRRGDYVSLESPRMILEPGVADAVRRAKLDGSPTFVYLANNIADERRVLAAAVGALAAPPLPLAPALVAYYGPSQVPYSAVAAVDLDHPVALLEKELAAKVKKLDADDLLPGIVLTHWEESPLKAREGERVVLSWFRPEGAEAGEQTGVFRVAAVLPMRGPLADRGLVPQVPGITNRLPSNWDAPFPFDRTRLHPQDDNFWKQHGTTPKAYVSLKVGQELWRSRFGELTSYRLLPGRAQSKEELEKAIVAQLNPRDGGFTFDDVKASALQASGGGSDFAMLFLAFSVFLIVSALLLVGLLFRLSLDRRGREVGVLLAGGWRLATVRRLLLLEGGLVAALGTVAGTGLALVYADLLLGRLRAWWPGGLDASTLRLHVAPLSLAIGCASALLVSVLMIYWSARTLGKMTPRALLGGRTTDEGSAANVPRSSRAAWSAGVALTAAVAALVTGTFVEDHEARAGTFFGSGIMLLIAGLSVLTLWLRREASGKEAGATAGSPLRGGVARLGLRNASRHSVRSLLTAGLLAAAAFLLVGVESFRREPDRDYLRPDGGSGGYALLAESDLPVFVDLNSEAGRVEMLASLRVRWQDERLSGDEIEARAARAEALLQSIKVVAFRVRHGDDASCLNLYQPRRPTLFGVPDSVINEGGFRFSGLVGDPEHPWKLLRVRLPKEPDVVPVFGEENTVVWMLKSGLGKELTVQDERGRQHSLEVVGYLRDSVFQNGLLMSEERFLSLYPGAQGYSFFLIHVRPGDEDEVRTLMETALADRGLAVTPAAERLASYLAVENMYLTAFQALGGMGLLLGTLGLAVVLLRSVWERRGELALLQALGYRRGTIGLLVLAENGFLLLAGLGLGTLAALLSVAPHALSGGGRVAWVSLLGMLGASLLVGLLASAAATAATVRSALIPSLRRE